MYDLFVMATTYQRPALCARLLHALAAQRMGLSIAAQVVLDDQFHDAPGYAHIFQDADIALCMQEQPHEGKAGYYRTITRLWEAARDIDARYYLQLQDDVELTPGALRALIATWEAIDDPLKICLNPMVDSTRERLYPFHYRKFGATLVRLGQWVDCLFFCERRLFEVLEWHLTDPEVTPPGRKKSSGVGAQLMHRLREMGYHLYQVDHSLVTHGDHPSVMHPERQTPIVSI